jgi:uncharacterized coiled-coil DUF342 family protein
MEYVMNKTKVDDLLIEMISPKIKEIEEKFSRGDGLNSEDINTLLLKSQYNHINHLDIKLNEVTAEVASLKDEFNGKFNGLKDEFNGKFNGLKDEFNDLKGEFKDLKGEFELLRVDLYAKFDNLEQKIETTIQKALNKNMIQLVIILGAFATIFRILDIFGK